MGLCVRRSITWEFVLPYSRGLFFSSQLLRWTLWSLKMTSRHHEDVLRNPAGRRTLRWKIKHEYCPNPAGIWRRTEREHRSETLLFFITFERFFGKMSCRTTVPGRGSLYLRSLLIERRFSQRKTLRTSYGFRCWFDCLFSSTELLQVNSDARTRHLLHLRDPLIEQHFQLEYNLYEFSRIPDASVAPLCSRRFTTV